jgi:HlyD family secretion protein
LKKLIIGLLIAAVAGAGIFYVVKMKKSKKKVTYSEVAVERGTLTEKALAVGKIDPDHEIVIKSQISGTVEKIAREVGEQVVRGEELMVVKPAPTPMELAEAQRQVELAELNRTYLKNDLKRAVELQKGNYISGKDFEATQRQLRESEVHVSQAQERLELLRKGTSKIGDIVVDSVIRSPTNGTILERLVSVGDPVVPLTSYQPGTELLRIAGMDDLIFIGTVDEIDVGKIKTGMNANIHIGALPKDTLAGELYFISPKSRLKDNVVVFDIKIKIVDAKSITLRAGYSASADLIIKEKKDVLHVPERLVKFKGDSTFVNLKGLAKSDSLIRQPVKIGFSDGLNVEILEGLTSGQKVVDK